MSNITNGVSLNNEPDFRIQSSINQIAQGQFRGEQVRIIGQEQSLLASAAEEMTFLRSERRSTELSRRKIGERPQERVNAIKKAAIHLEKNAEFDNEKYLTQLFAQLLSSPQISPEIIKETLQQDIIDITQQYLALVFVREQLLSAPQRDDTKNNKLLASVDTLLDTLMEEHEAEIQAGLNITDVGARFASTQLGNLSSLRFFYRDAVLDYGNLSTTYKKIIDDHSEEAFSTALKFLIAALGADISSEGPSLPKERLTIIIEDLYKLQSLSFIDDQCSEFITQLKRIYNMEKSPDKHDLMTQLLTLLENKWINTQHLLDIATALNVSKLSSIFFWRGFKELIREVPIKIFQDPFERQNILTAIQNHLDFAIEQEAMG